MSHLRADPPLFDISAWRAWLAELRADAPSAFRDGLIFQAESHIAALEANPQKKPPEAA